MLDGAIEGGVELGYVGVTAHAAEADRRTDDPCADPAQEHCAALPVLHVSCEAADAAVQVLNRVGAAQRPVGGTPDAEALQSGGLDEALDEQRQRDLDGDDGARRAVEFLAESFTAVPFVFGLATTVP